MSTVDSISLSNAVVSLQAFLSQSAAQGISTPDRVRERAVQSDYPYPEVAAQVFKFLQIKKVAIDKLTHEDVSDAFLQLLLDPDAVDALGAGKAQNPWQAVRLALRTTGTSFGAALLELYTTVRERGLGYTPTLLELASELTEIFSSFQQAGKSGEPALRAFCKGREVAAWKVALAALWLRRRGKDGGVPTDHELEEIFADKKLMAALEKEQPEGPWDVYRGQAEALKMLRHFGESLLALDEGVA